MLMVLVMVLGCLVGCGGGSSTEPAGDETGDKSLQKVLDSGKLHVAVSPDYAPYEYLDLITGEIKGSDIEFSKYIAEQLGVEVVFEQMNFESCLAAGTTGSVDLVITCMGYSPERAESMELSEQYNIFSNMKNTVLTTAEMAPSLNVGEDFAGLVIAAQNGSTMYDKAAAELPGVKEVKAVSSIAEGIMMLQEGKVDGVAMSSNVAKEFCENYEGLGIAGFAFAAEKKGNVVGAAKGSVALMEKVNEIVIECNENGQFEAWYNAASEEAKQQGL